ncbi:MAG TPA: hypothetical protein VFX69_12780 [Steroidobacteraceae bacterium]|jgi:hypothetical protein|nr:hypothetical protein [Steroidobacteraceae bacterium]
MNQSGGLTMKITLALACAFALSASPAAWAGPNYGCDSVNFGQEVLDKFPNAKRLCRGIKEKDGGIYVHYVGKVVASSPESVTVEFLDKDEKAVSRATFVPAADQSVSIENKKMKYSDVKKGTKLDFYIENNRWGLYMNPGEAKMTVLKVEQL